MDETRPPQPPSPPPGFYRDPNGLPAERWWDGTKWADSTRSSGEADIRPGTIAAVRRWDWGRIANFKSRARRVEFWAAWALAVSATFIGGFIDASISPDASLFTLISIGIWVWLFWGASVNRFHDMGKSGWMFLLFLIPLVNVGVFLWLGVQEGQPQANQWGPPVS